MLGLLAPFAVFRRVAPENVGPLTLFLVERREILGRISGLCQAKLRLKRAAGRPQGRVSATSEVTHDLASSQRKIYLSIYLSLGTGHSTLVPGYTLYHIYVLVPDILSSGCSIVSVTCS